MQARLSTRWSKKKQIVLSLSFLQQLVSHFRQIGTETSGDYLQTLLNFQLHFRRQDLYQRQLGEANSVKDRSSPQFAFQPLSHSHFRTHHHSQSRDHLHLRHRDIHH
jgi:hypothetical protein